MNARRWFNALCRVPAWLWISGLFVLVVSAYAQTFSANFIWDDDAHLTRHPCIVGPLGFKEIWTTAEADYFPLVLTTLWGLHRLFGLDPFVYHLVTVVLHGGCAVMMAVVLRRLGVALAILAAAAWALHPVQVESVAWVSEITNTQSTFFFLAAIWLWLISGEAEQGSAAGRTTYLCCLGCAAAAMLSKPAAVMLPVALGLSSLWRGHRLPQTLVRLAPLTVLSLGVASWAIWEQKFHAGANGADWNLAWWQRPAIAARGIWFYLREYGWPYPLNFIQPRWTIDRFLLADGLRLGAFVAITAWLVVRRSRRGLVYLSAFFVAMLFPVLGFFDVYYFRYAFVADHFQYLASMGLAVATAALFGRGLSAIVGYTAYVAAAAVLAAWMVLTCAQTRMYQSPARLYTTMLARDPDSWIAHNNYGQVLAERGGNPDDELHHYQTAAALNPGFAEAHNNLGAQLAANPGRRDDAIRELETAVRLDPQLTIAQLNLARLLATRPNQLAAAIEHFQAALRSNPRSADTHRELAAVLARIPDRRSEAMDHYREAIRLNPTSAVLHEEYAELLDGEPGLAEASIREHRAAIRLGPRSAVAHYNLANAIAARPEGESEALAEYSAALAIDPTMAEAHVNLANLLVHHPDSIARAITHYETALELRPQFGLAHVGLANALLRLPGRCTEAIAHFRSALAAGLDDPMLHNNLAAAYAQIGQVDAAISECERALQLNPDLKEAQVNLRTLQRRAGSPRE